MLTQKCQKKILGRFSVSTHPFQFPASQILHFLRGNISILLFPIINGTNKYGRIFVPGKNIFISFLCTYYNQDPAGSYKPDLYSITTLMLLLCPFYYKKGTVSLTLRVIFLFLHLIFCFTPPPTTHYQHIGIGVYLGSLPIYVQAVSDFVLTSLLGDDICAW